MPLPYKEVLDDFDGFLLDFAAETEENTNTNEGESLLKEIELNFKQIKKNAPNEISSQIQTYYAQFITLTKGSEKDHIYDNLKILNTIVNNTSDTLKSIEDLPKKVRNYLSQLKMALYQLNSLRNIVEYQNMNLLLLNFELIEEFLYNYFLLFLLI